MKLKLNEGFRQFLWKTVLFIGMFMAFIFLIGTKLYHYDILSGWKIEIYGRVGYILLFSLAGFILLYRERLMELGRFKHKWGDFLLVALSFISLAGFYAFEIYAYKFSINLTNIALVHILGVSIFVFLILGIYGLDFIKNFLRRFRKELLYFLIFGIVAASLMDFVWGLWPYFSDTVLRLVAFLLKTIGANFRIIEPRTIIVGSFGAQIADACSGVYSIFLFLALYLFIAFVDWKEIDKKKATALLIPAVVGAFLVNVLRVFFLFIIGAYVSRDLAMGMYHSYTGMIFFLIYFAIFWVLFYNWMKKPEFRKEKQGLIGKNYDKVMGDSLYRNSIYLMLNTLVMAVLGFVFWIVASRIYPTADIGLATAIISVGGLITSFSLLGLNTGLIRYLPTAENKDKKINTSFTLVAIVTIIISSIFLLLVKVISPRLVFIHDNIILAFVFIIFMIFISFSSLMDSIFIAYRNTKFVLLDNTIFCVLKVLLLFVFVWLGAYGIFSSYMIGMIVGFLVVFVILMARFNYKPKFAFYDSIIRKIGGYSFGNYVAGFIGGLPTVILPLLILNKLGAESSAYYYMAMMVATLLFAVPSATSNSLFAEGSHDEKNMKGQIRKAVKINALLLIPGILIFVFLGQYVLLAFGKQYSIEGFRFLQLLALSGVFVGVNSVFGTLLKVKKRVKSLIVVSIFSAVLILGGSYLLIGRGLLGIGYAWIFGQAIVSAVYLLIWRRNTQKHFYKKVSQKTE
jgi:exosortase/archaeosortase family protein